MRYPCLATVVLAICGFAIHAAPALAIPQLSNGLPPSKARILSGLLNSIEIRLQQHPPQMKSLVERERRRPLRRNDRVGAASYGAILDGASRLQGLARLHFVNSAWNNLRYASDQALYGKDDYWATPAETASKGSGDCEDLAVAKYYTLRDLGHPADSLRLLLVSLRATGQKHMLLCIKEKNASTCLDNRHKRLLDSQEASRDYKPLLSINERLSAMHFSPQTQRSPRIATNVAAKMPKAKTIW